MTLEQFVRALRQNFKSLNVDDRERAWNILTALRGPDFKDTFGEVKQATTAVVRGAVFGDLVEALATSVRNDESGPSPRRRLATGVSHDTQRHFTAHAREAFSALGLDWYADNGVIGLFGAPKRTPKKKPVKKRAAKKTRKRERR